MKTANVAVEVLVRPAAIPAPTMRSAGQPPLPSMVRQPRLGPLRSIWTLACLLVSLPVFVVASIGLVAALYLRGMRALLEILLTPPAAPVLLPQRPQSGAHQSIHSACR
jgi:hypothetical protein